MIRFQPITTSDVQHYKFMEELLDRIVSTGRVPATGATCAKYTDTG